MARRPTILDVARHAGVSKSTVSLVLRRSPLVRDSTREAVAASMETLGYVYNRAAAGIRGAHSGLVGLVMNDIRNPFFTEFAASAQMTFADGGIATVIANTDEDPDLQDRVIATMIEHGVSAFVISPAYGGADPFGRILRAGIPALGVLRRIDGSSGDIPYAAPDFGTGGELATRHLVDLGCRNIAFVGGIEGLPVTRERMSGYERVMAEADWPLRTFLGRPSRRFGRDVAQTLLSEVPGIDGALCFSDLVALGLMAGLTERHVDVGVDFRVIGFDDIEEASLSHPRLSSIRCDIAGFGVSAAETMLEWLASGKRPAPDHRTPIALVARQSTLGLHG